MQMNDVPVAYCDRRATAPDVTFTDDPMASSEDHVTPGSRIPPPPPPPRGAAYPSDCQQPLLPQRLLAQRTIHSNSRNAIV